MKVNLTTSDNFLKFKFENLQNFNDIASLLEIPSKVLWKNVINKKEYHAFKIPKKQSDKFRTINKPSKNLSIIQKKLNYILSIVYNSSHTASHGFEKEKSIRTNAECHLKMNQVLNLDLENFFNSINFPRVRAMFMTYFKFNNEVATTMANICCDNNNVLPQGAATSPIISNIIAYKLDKQLNSLARRNRWIYTRYADDLSFSTNREKYNSDIFIFDEDLMMVGEKVEHIIQANGFKINKSKTRIYDKSKAKYVTGIKVNSKLNVSRTYIRRIRSILHTIEKNIEDINEAERIFKDKYSFRPTIFKDLDMLNVVRGMISHVGHIKGKQDELFQKFVIRYNEIIKKVNVQKGKKYAFIHRPYTKVESRRQNTFVIEENNNVVYKVATYERTFNTKQGSGFLLKGIGLVTNWHVVQPYIDNVIADSFAKFDSEYYIPITKSKYSKDIWFAKVLTYDKPRDLAVLQIEGIDEQQYGFDYSLDISENMECCLLGYPEYTQGQTLHEVEGKIQSQRINRYNPNEFIRYTTTMSIYGGNSGGPIVNNDNKVIAVAVKGSDNTVSEVIPVGDLLESINEKQMQKVENHNMIDYE